MNTIVNSTIWLLSFFAFCGIANGADVEASPVDFHNDLIPVFTKNGCNTGACHGAAIGRGGFKLSLYGGDPKSDYSAIVHQLSGRRINLARPDQSLIVMKPAEFISHGGGTIFDADSNSAELLIDWVRQGAHSTSHRELKSVEVSPRKHVADTIGESVNFRAVARYFDGTHRDVTEWTIFQAEDPSAVAINTQSAAAQILRRGRHVVVARFLNEVVPIELLTPFTDVRPDLTSHRRVNFIDDEVLSTLETLGLSPSEEIADPAFLRRITLDLTGRLPSIEQARQFSLHDDKREADRLRLIGKLLDSSEFQQYWTLQFAKLLRIRTQAGDSTAAHTYHNWLTQQLAANTSYDQFAKTLITAWGNTEELGPPNFYRTVKDARQQAEFFSELFMGTRLRCANCHNHPLDRWTQDDYHGLAAIFAKVEASAVVKPRPTGQAIHPRTLEPALLRIPGEQFLADGSQDGREQLAEWLTAKENPFFARAIVNRLWKHMLGRGLVEPVDDFRSTNPATHPILLNRLADDFVANGYDLRHTLRMIAQSATYALSAKATAENKDDDRFYSHAARRTLQPEVRADAISDVLGIAEKYGDEMQGTRAIALVDPKTPSRTLDVLGRCGREESCESSAAAIGGLPQQLHLLNGSLLNDRISAPGGRLHTLLAQKKAPIAIITEFYLAALSRQPTKLETQHWMHQLDATPQADQSAFLNDFVWGLLSCKEFVTNH